MVEFQHMKKILHKAFKIKDLGVLKYGLGLEAAHPKQGIFIFQRKYCIDLLANSFFLGYKPANTPSDHLVNLCHDNSLDFEDIPTYQRLIGRLIYLKITIPNSTFITQQLS